MKVMKEKHKITIEIMLTLAEIDKAIRYLEALYLELLRRYCGKKN